MRYKLENSAPVEIRKVIFEGLTITNPTDAFIDENGLGYPKEETTPPAYDPDEEKISFEWSVVDGTIKKVWTVTELSASEKAAIKNAKIDVQIDTVNAEYDAWQTTPVDYDFNGQTLCLKPIWVTQYYGTLLQASTLGAMVFPSRVTDAQNVTVEMSETQFVAMYLWLVGQAAVKIATVNAEIATLEAQKEVVNAEF